MEYMNKKSALYNKIEEKDLYTLSALKAPLSSDVKLKIMKKSINKVNKSSNDDID
jgi:hypothetical protein